MADLELQLLRAHSAHVEDGLSAYHMNNDDYATGIINSIECRLRLLLSRRYMPKNDLRVRL